MSTPHRTVNPSQETAAAHLPLSLPLLAHGRTDPKPKPKNHTWPPDGQTVEDEEGACEHIHGSADIGQEEEEGTSTVVWFARVIVAKKETNVMLLPETGNLVPLLCSFENENEAIDEKTAYNLFMRFNDQAISRGRSPKCDTFTLRKLDSAFSRTNSPISRDMFKSTTRININMEAR